jgi:hypothetical protein
MGTGGEASSLRNSWHAASIERNVATALLELTSAVDADLITVGRHSRSVIERFFVGSVGTHGRSIPWASCATGASSEQSPAHPRDPERRGAMRRAGDTCAT